MGYGLNDIETANCSWMVLYWKIKIYKRPKWNTKLKIKTWPKKFNKISSWRDFEVYDEEGNKIVIATSEWVLINAKELTIGGITEKMINDYGLNQESVFEEETNGKLKEPEKTQKIYKYTARRRDGDTNHHVNNVNYLEFAYDALPKEVIIDFNNIEIYYKKQIKIR